MRSDVSGQPNEPLATPAPSSPAKRPFFYGWVVLAVASIANTIAYGAVSVSESRRATGPIQGIAPRLSRVGSSDLAQRYDNREDLV